MWKMDELFPNVNYVMIRCRFSGARGVCVVQYNSGVATQIETTSTKLYYIEAEWSPTADEVKCMNAAATRSFMHTLKETVFFSIRTGST